MKTFFEFNLNREIKACNKCNIACNRGFGYGNIKSKIMFLAQGPGWQPQSRSSEIIPFGLDVNGQNSGEWLVKLLNEAKLKATDYYVTNVVKCPTPYNRPPKDHELFNCLHFLRMELEQQRPLLIFMLGRTAKDVYNFYMKRLFKNLKDHTWFPCFLWHPAFVMRDQRNFKQWRIEFLEFWEKHKHMVEPVKISYQRYKHHGVYTVGNGSWDGAVYEDIYKAEGFRKFLRSKM